MTIDIDVVIERTSFALQFAASVRPGVTAVIGPNGAGKTTLLRMLAGLERVDRGRVTIDGVIVDDGGRVFVPPSDRSIGMVFQDHALFPHLSVLENVAFGARARGMRVRPARQRAQALLDRMGVGELAQRRPQAVSAGQAQRIALARALAVQPAVLLLDEPLAALDAESRQLVRVELERVLAGFAGTSLLVTHDPVDAMLLADRVLVLESGRIVQDDAPAAVARRPATEYVAALMGVNLLRGSARDGVLELDTGGVLHLADRSIRGRAAAVVRPESIVIHRIEPEGSARNCWHARVSSVQRMHDRVRVALDGAPAVVATVTAEAVADLHLATGAPVWLTVKAVDIDVYAMPQP